ncbi:female-specific protein transformer-like isoform X1 [Apis cerana]|uniref:female-specific protein transformer-like isoform X1 n=1 Tax=Apis cerana TaxID=7461 RepID=UPI002B232137|nr:female-specific protein transformer-like isoform X1 [Apis cerana]XP_061928986.1 female-specific protein transformer-like isoform X1 [Apis cerana]XP_061928987.1 female-specific protein transformer-like isoform X1 [Apis cerana]
MIFEYELQRKKELAKRNRTESRSLESQNRNNASTANTSTALTLFEKLESSDGTSLFRGPEGTQVSATELRKIKVDIHRVLPGKPTTTTDELKRDIINPEDVMLKRRTGEGSKPIFEREEIKNVLTKTNEITEHRTVLAVNIEKSELYLIILENETKTCKKYAISSNSLRSRSRSFQRTSSCHSRYEDSRHEDRNSYRNDRERSCSRDRSREYKKKDRRYDQLHNVEEKHLRERTSRRRYSRSREREQKSYKNEREYREYRETSRERSRDRRERERSRKHRIIPSHYIEQIPVPVYYGNFPPRPIMVRPWVPMRGQVPGSRHIGPLTPFPPRFIPPDMYRLRPPPNPRFGPMY